MVRTNCLYYTTGVNLYCHPRCQTWVKFQSKYINFVEKKFIPKYLPQLLFFHASVYRWNPNIPACTSVYTGGVWSFIWESETRRYWFKMNWSRTWFGVCNFTKIYRSFLESEPNIIQEIKVAPSKTTRIINNHIIFWLHITTVKSDCFTSRSQMGVG